MYVERAMYSFKMSFWTVPRSTPRRTLRPSATAMYRASRIGAVALIVMLVLTRSSGSASKRRPMSSRVELATPTRPTSPRASGASLSYPIWVGRSNATLSPSLPCARRYWNRRFVSFAVPKPAYCRIVQRRPRYIVARMPRVNGGSPGNPILEEKSSADSFAGVRTMSRGRPLPVCPDDVVGGDVPLAGFEWDFVVLRRVAMEVERRANGRTRDKDFFSTRTRKVRAGAR